MRCRTKRVHKICNRTLPLFSVKEMISYSPAPPPPSTGVFPLFPPQPWLNIIPDTSFVLLWLAGYTRAWSSQGNNERCQGTASLRFKGEGKRKQDWKPWGELYITCGCVKIVDVTRLLFLSSTLFPLSFSLTFPPPSPLLPSFLTLFLILSFLILPGLKSRASATCESVCNSEGLPFNMNVVYWLDFPTLRSCFAFYFIPIR